MDNDFGNEYSWLGNSEKSWETAHERNERNLSERSTNDIIQKTKRQQMLGRNGSVQIGMVRNMVLIIDGSESMNEGDLKPNRFSCVIKHVEEFVEEFFDCNSVSQLSLMTLKNKKCELLTEFGGNKEIHLKSLSNLKRTYTEGGTSLYNGLDQAHKLLKNVPTHVSREILIIHGSISSLDPYDIDILIKVLKASGIKCSIIGLSAGLRICEQICKDTRGTHRVSVDENHLKAHLQEHLLPPLSHEGQESSQMKMGFPQFDNTTDVRFAMCMRHLGSNDKDCYGKGGYLCPQCSCKYCEIPMECVTCGLMLVSSAHLARSYLHLFPLEAFEEVAVESNSFCYGCQKQLTDPTACRCKKCCQDFCVDCDILFHESLRKCPGC